MADTIFSTVEPDLKAMDNGDDTYAVAAEIIPVFGGSEDTIFKDTYPPLKAVYNGDGTYSIAGVPM